MFNIMILTASITIFSHSHYELCLECCHKHRTQLIMLHPLWEHSPHVRPTFALWSNVCVCVCGELLIHHAQVTAPPFPRSAPASMQWIIIIIFLEKAQNEVPRFSRHNLRRGAQLSLSLSPSVSLQKHSLSRFFSPRRRINYLIFFGNFFHRK